MHGTLQPITLAKRCGIYRERSAPASLAAHVECLWSHAIPAGPRLPMAVVPDGCVDIIWSSVGIAVVGPDRVAAFPAIGPGETVVGLRFRTGMAASWLRTSLCELTGSVVPLEAFWGAAAGELFARMAEAGSVAARAAILAQAAEQRLPMIAAPPADIGACLAQLRQVRPTSSDNPIRSLAQATGSSARTLRRRCHEHFGYGAKTLDRILRLQRFLAACRSDAQPSLTTLALDAGYADQAHLTRETRELTSLSPREIRRQLAN
ncbi:AraC family transcriptional regulator [Ensifer sp. HO-A22]|uniref:AraC family transcriptional regulator n=1 Tax=Ensifer oleiphilus TaxID=2742698 RepID=A0A7Y6UMC7_9HYPH|nr:helix-turn-helix domain-containing protein [Ensifer oleiphilus]NVD38834.1 AraC family transcriptional regulator [Ensifer oleiphilus]